MTYVPVKIVGRMPSFDCEIWWRADIRTYADYDPWAEFEQPSGPHDVIELRPYEVVRHTPKGVVVRSFLSGEIRVRGNAKRQECVPTKELALQDLVARMDLHATMAQKRADRALRKFKAAVRALERNRADRGADMEESK